VQSLELPAALCQEGEFQAAIGMLYSHTGHAATLHWSTTVCFGTVREVADGLRLSWRSLVDQYTRNPRKMEWSIQRQHSSRRCLCYIVGRNTLRTLPVCGQGQCNFNPRPLAQESLVKIAHSTACWPMSDHERTVGNGLNGW